MKLLTWDECMKVSGGCHEVKGCVHVDNGLHGQLDVNGPPDVPGTMDDTVHADQAEIRSLITPG